MTYNIDSKQPAPSAGGGGGGGGYSAKNIAKIVGLVCAIGGEVMVGPAGMPLSSSNPFCGAPALLLAASPRCVVLSTQLFLTIFRKLR